MRGATPSSSAVSAIVSNVLPDGVTMKEDAAIYLQNCASEFISMMTCEAADKGGYEKRKSKFMNADDVMGSLEALGFVNLVPPSRLYNDKLSGLKTKVDSDTKKSKGESETRSYKRKADSATTGDLAKVAKASKNNQATMKSADVA